MIRKDTSKEKFTATLLKEKTMEEQSTNAATQESVAGTSLEGTTTGTLVPSVDAEREKTATRDVSLFRDVPIDHWALSSVNKLVKMACFLPKKYPEIKTGR